MAINNTKRERRDRDVLFTATKRIWVLGPRTVQESRSSHWYGYTVSARIREPGGDWLEVRREDLRGVERWDDSAENKIGGLGAVVTDAPPDDEVQGAIERAFEALDEDAGSRLAGSF